MTPIIEALRTALGDDGVLAPAEIAQRPSSYWDASPMQAAALAEPKTARLTAHFGKLGISSALVIAGAEVDTNFARAAANIAHVDVLPQQGANVYDILRRDTLVLTRDAVKHLEERLQ